MTKQQADLLKRVVEADERITADIVGAGTGYRLRLILHKESRNKRTLILGSVDDLPLIKQMWFQSSATPKRRCNNLMITHAEGRQV